MPPKSLISSPPWRLDRDWIEANRSFKIHIDRYRSELGSVLLSAQDVRYRLAVIFPLNLLKNQIYETLSHLSYGNLSPNLLSPLGDVI